MKEIKEIVKPSGKVVSVLVDVVPAVEEVIEEPKVKAKAKKAPKKD